MAAYKIASGDTLSKIAGSYGTTVDDLLNLNKNNPSVKTRDLIIAGGSLNVPESESPNPKPSPTTTPGDTTASSAVPPNIFPDTGISSSFMSNISKDLEKNQANMEKLFPEPGSVPKEQTPEYQAYQIGQNTTKSLYDIARGDVASARAVGEEQARKAAGLLGMTPAAIRQNIEDYTTQHDAFEKSIASNLERLTVEENNALAQNDLNYLNSVRQNKVDWLNMQRQAMEDKMNFMGQAFNMMMGGAQLKQAEQQTGTNFINMLMGSGVKYDQLSPQEKANFDAAASSLGLDSETAAGMLGHPDVKQYITRGDWTYAMDAKGNMIRDPIYTPQVSTGAGTSGQAMVDRWRTTGLNPGQKYDPVVQAEIDKNKAGPGGQEAYTFRNLLTSNINSELKSKVAGGLGWTADNALRTAETQKNTAINTTVNNILNDSKTLNTLLPGKTKETMNQDDINTLTQYVKDSYDYFVPTDYITNVIGHITIPGYYTSPSETTVEGQ